MSVSVSTVAGILILAVIVEAVVEYFVAPAVKPPSHDAPEAEGMDAPLGGVDWRSLALRYSAAAIGVALCIVYACDLLALVGLSSPYPVVGQIVTGLLIGRGANYINDFADTWLSRGAGLLR